MSARIGGTSRSRRQDPRGIEARVILARGHHVDSRRTPAHLSASADRATASVDCAERSADPVVREGTRRASPWERRKRDRARGTVARDILARVRAVVRRSPMPFSDPRTNRRAASPSVRPTRSPRSCCRPCSPRFAARRRASWSTMARSRAEARRSPKRLDATRCIDVACYPLDELPARFEARALYEEDFVIAARSGHALGKRPSLEQ